MKLRVYNLDGKHPKLAFMNPEIPDQLNGTLHDKPMTRREVLDAIQEARNVSERTAQAMVNTWYAASSAWLYTYNGQRVMAMDQALTLTSSCYWAIGVAKDRFRESRVENASGKRGDKAEP